MPELQAAHAATTPEPLASQDLEVLNTMHRIADGADLNLSDRLSAVVKVVAYHLHSDACSIYLAEDWLSATSDGQSPGSGRFLLAATHGLNPEAVGRVHLQAGEGVTGWVGRECAALSVSDTRKDDRFKAVQEMDDQSYRAILAAPIRLDQQLVGVINVQSRQRVIHPPTQVRLLETIGMHLGGIIRSAHQHEEARRQLKHLRLINGIGQALVSTLHLDPLLRMVMDKSCEITDTRGGVLRLWDDETQQLVIQTTVGEPLPDSELVPRFLGEGLSGITALKQECCRINPNDDTDTRLPDGVRHGYLCVPVVFQGRAIGTISVFDRQDCHGRPVDLTAEDQSLLQALANQVAVAITNAQVCDQLENQVSALSHTREHEVQRDTLLAVSRMASAMIRHVREPLAPVRALVGRLKEGGLPQERVTEYLDVIQQETDRLEGFLAAVSQMEESAAACLVECDVDPWVQGVVAGIAGRTEARGITVEVSANTGMRTYLDPEQATLAVQAMLNNAIEALPNGGQIKVRVEACAHPVCGTPLDGIRIAVQDSGEGLNEASMSELFAPFFSTKPGGRGLGLTLAYRIARAHGGVLLGNNPPEGGAEFSLFFPLTSPDIALR